MIDAELKRQVQWAARAHFEEIANDCIEAKLSAGDCLEPLLWQMEHAEHSGVKELCRNRFHPDRKELLEIVRAELGRFF